MSETEINVHNLSGNQSDLISEVLLRFAHRVESVTVTNTFKNSSITETVKLQVVDVTASDSTKPQRTRRGAGQSAATSPC